MKTFLWLSTVVGLLPLMLLAIVHLTMMAFVHWTNRDPDTIVFIGDTQVSIASLKPVHLSSSPWPSILILLGACVLIVGLWYLGRTPLPLNVEDGEPAESVLEEPPDKAGG